jgi:tripartite-type tricarboxylate transporter receptor subunit TctC
VIAKKIAVIAGALLMCSVATVAMAEGYPNKPVTLISGFAPTGGEDFSGRVMASMMSDYFQVPVSVLNILGADGGDANVFFNSRAKDGYTLLFGRSSIHLRLPLMKPNLDFKMSDYKLIGVSDISWFGCAVNPGRGDIGTADKFIQSLKSKPMTYSVQGEDARIFIEYLIFSAQEEIVSGAAKHQVIPLTPGSSSISDVVRGKADFTCAPTQQLLRSFKGAQVNVILTNEPKDGDAVFPASVKRADDINLGRINMITSWSGLYVHKDVPEEVVSSVTKAFSSVVGSNEWKKAVSSVGSKPLALTGSEAGRFVQNASSDALSIVLETAVAGVQK